MTSLERTASYCADQLRRGLGDDCYASTRNTIQRDAIEQLAHQMAESATGVSRAQYDLTKRYSRSTLWDYEIERGHRYRVALAPAFFELNQLNYQGLLERCESLCGERQAALAS